MPAGAKLHSLSLSHPSQAARLMLERKGIDHDVVELLPGFHPVQLRAAGFRGGTVPGLKIEGARVQGSRQISRALDELHPDPPLFPADPGGREEVVEAERWGEEVLQPAPRRMFRWGVAGSGSMRRWMAADIMGLPAPSVMAAANKPVAWYFARKSRADFASVRAIAASVPALLDRVDELIAAGTIGGEPNAADYQIATAVRVLLAYDDLRGSIEGRPCAELAMRTLPDYPGPIPRFLPPEWLAPLQGR
ncbi:MAG: glutathione S-transferase family protein [Solirubrobacterales bacterium]